jgi:hypothetical protein
MDVCVRIFCVYVVLCVGRDLTTAERIVEKELEISM